MYIPRTLSLLAMVVITCAVTACSGDFESGAQFPGQECTVDDHCASGLRCVERRCRALTGGTNDDAGDANNDSNANGANDNTNDDEPPLNDVDNSQANDDEPPFNQDNNSQANDDEPPFNQDNNSQVNDDEPPFNQDNNSQVNDEEPPCTPGESSCVTETTLRQCAVDAEGRAIEVISDCEAGYLCDDGQCRPVDDDPEPCCEGGCADDQICQDCACVDIDTQTCQFQDQPCQTEGQITNGFICSNLDNPDLELRCVGLCSPNANDPNSTCPDADSVCSFESPDDPNGFCFSSCTVDQGCDHEDLGCIYSSTSPQEGICLPATGDGQVGDSCDTSDPYSCAGQNLCIEGICRASCRPFDQPTSDCPGDSYCLPADENFGFCADDTSTDDGGCTEEFTTCGADSTGCFSAGFTGAPTCLDFCRRDLGNDDCPDSACVPIDNANDTLGMCL